MEQSTVEICDACSKGDLDLVKRLITRGTSPWVRDDHGNTLIHLCCSSYHCGLDVLQYLIATSEIVSCGYLRNNKGSTPLYLSCGAGKKEFVEFLIHGHHNDNFDFGLPNYQGETPLYFASRNGHSNIVSLICTNPDYILDPDDIYQCIKVAPNWDIMAILLRAISFNDFMTRVRQENHVYLAKQIFKTSVTIQWKDSSSPPLHQVAKSGDLDIVQYLVNEVGCDVNGLDSEAYTPLHRAIEYGHLPIVQYLLSQPQCNCETRSNNCGMYPLHHAAEFGYLEIIKALDGKGCDINVSDDKGYTPIHNACNNGHLLVVKYLSSKPQCNLEVLDNTGHQPLHYALCQGQKEIVMLLREKVSVDGIHQCIKSAVEDKVPGSMIELLVRKIGIKEYLTRRLEEDQPTFSNNDTVLRNIIEIDCPLHEAVELGCVDVTEYLVNIGVFDINLKLKYRYNTPLHIACEKGHFEIVKILTNHPQCNIEAENNNKQRPLHKACQSGNVDVVQHLMVEKGCDVTAKSNWGDTPLHIACEKGHFEIVKILTNHPQCNIEAENNNKQIPLHKACQSGNVDVVQHLVVEKGCDVTAKESWGDTLLHDTPLHDACRKGHFEIVKILTNHPQCNIEAENNSKQRPLHIACLSGNVDIVQHLVIEKGCDVTAKDEGSDTPLHKACRKGHFEIVKILTNHPQCNIEAENNIKRRPLHIACLSGNVNVVQHLVVENSCDVTAKDNWGDITPLHVACKKGHFELLKIMQTNYPNWITKLINYHYNKLLQLARQSGNADVIKFINEQSTITYVLKSQQALRTSGEAMLCVVKCILTGPPGAGKSTLKKRLLNESLTEPSLSTGVVDAAIQVSSFRKLQQHNAVVTTEWRTQDLDEEAVLMFENILTGTSRNHRSTTSSDDIECASSSVMTEINDTDIKNGYTDEYEEEGSDIYSDIEVNTTERQNDTEEMNEELEEEESEDNNKELKRKEQENGSTSHCLPTNSEIIQFNSSSSSSTVTSFRATNEIDNMCNYTCELEEDGGDNYGDIEVNTTKGQKNTEEIVKEAEERGIEVFQSL